MRTYVVNYYIIRGCLRSLEVTAVNYNSAKSEFERLTGISRKNIIKILFIKNA